MIKSQTFSNIQTGAEVYCYLIWAGWTAWDNSLAKDFRLDMENWAKDMLGVDTLAAETEADNKALMSGAVENNALIGDLARLGIDGYSFPGCFLMTKGPIAEAEHFVAVGFDEDYKFRETSLPARKLFQILSAIEYRNKPLDYLSEICVRCQRLVGRDAAAEVVGSLDVSVRGVIDSGLAAARFLRKSHRCVAVCLPGLTS